MFGSTTRRAIAPMLIAVMALLGILSEAQDSRERPVQGNKPANLGPDATVPQTTAPVAPRSLEDMIRREAEDSLMAIVNGEAEMPQQQPRRLRMPGAFNCFPSCSATDGRFLVIASADLITLSDPVIELGIGVPSDVTTFTLGIFDGDGSSTDSAGDFHWDNGIPDTNYTYTLFADADRDGVGDIPVDLLPGFPSIPSSAMSSNAWRDFSVDTSASAQSPGGNFFYVLRIELADVGATTLNAFKVRTDGVVTIEPFAQPFSYIANWSSPADLGIIYPGVNNPPTPLPPTTPTNYDGAFRFFIDVEDEVDFLEIWDGDFDRGSYDGTDQDTDDPNTPNDLSEPPFANATALSEGVADGFNGTTGNPSDNTDPTTFFGPYAVRSPAVRYELILPDGSSVGEPNPSGNQEWERFLVSTGGAAPAAPDAVVPALPAGIYELRAIGVDMQNLNAVRLPFRALCVSETGVPCVPLRPFLLGDTVFIDSDGNGTQDAGEPGVENVLVELLDNDGDVIASATTDASGNYSFPVEAGTYSVRVAASNSEPGGPLEGLLSTTGELITDTVLDDNVLTYDFGYLGGGTIGNFVWFDANGNGQQDEPAGSGIGGVTMRLVEAGPDGFFGSLDDIIFPPLVTDENGIYDFTDLLPGEYEVDVDESTLPVGLFLTTVNEPFQLTLGQGEDFDDADFGYNVDTSVAFGTLGDFVWYDVNADGVQDANEPGLANVPVSLGGDIDSDGMAEVVLSTNTDSDGMYLFTPLPEGSYTVTVDATDLETDGLDQRTFDFDGVATPDTAEVVLFDCADNGGGISISSTGGASTRAPEDCVILDLDFGYTGSNSLGDRVWEDLNGDGNQDAGEPGINGLTVELRDSNGNLLATAVTSGDGNYTFTNLPADTYMVTVVPPADLDPTFDLDGVDSANTATVTLASGQDRTDVDFGYANLSSIGDRVWEDLNGDGIQDAGEPGVDGVTVQLLDSSNTVVDSTVTSGGGSYLFSGLAPGSYSVRFTAPAGFAFTLPNQGGDENLDSDADAGTGNTTAVALSAGTDVDFVDAGIYRPASLGDRVWDDANGDGIQDAGENGVENVSVQVVDSGGSTVASLSTGPAGDWQATGLAPGSYTVRFTAPAGFGFTLQDQGGDDTVDSDANPATGVTNAVSVASGEDNSSVDAGLVRLGSLGDRVWNDANGDGVQDAGEAGINGVTVNLLDGGGSPIDSAITSGDGGYSFSNLPAGSYSVQIDATTLPAGLVQTFDLDGTGSANSAQVSLAIGENRDDVDFGYAPLGSLGDRVWNDVNGNGAQDAGESGINGVIVRLFDSGGGLVASATTSGDGNYSFADLPAGNYIVEVDAATLPAGLTPSFDLDGTGSANSAAASLAAGQDRDDVDFGYVALSSLGDRVWEDTNGDGVQDAGEAGINGVTVELLDAGSNVVGSATTSGDGNYSFGGLLPGTYSVRVDAATVPAGFTPTFDLDGLVTPNLATVTLAAGESRGDVDFGYRMVEGGGDPLCVVAAEPTLVSGGHALWLPGIASDLVFEPTPGLFEQLDGGIATITGTARRASDPASGFTASITFSGLQTSAPAGSPKKELPASAYVENGGTVDTATWIYYTGTQGTLTGFGSFAGVSVELNRSGPAFQVGNGANNKNADFGASGWFDWSILSQPSGSNLPTGGIGDINVDLVDCSTIGECITIDFEVDANGDYLNAGDVVADQWASLGVHIRSMNQGTYPAMIFDSASPTGGDRDLGTPNQGFGGPGIGSGGAPGTAGANGDALGNVLIISEDGDSNDPDDKGNGGTLIFTFDSAVTVESLQILDIDDGMNGTISAFDAGGSLILTVPMLDLGNNSVQIVPVGATGVRTLKVSFPGSGAVAGIKFCPENGGGGGGGGGGSCEPGEVADHFDTASFSNDDGTDSWFGPWEENETQSGGDGPGSGQVRIAGGRLKLDDYPDTGGSPGVSRTVDLSGAAQATFRFDFWTTSGVDSSDAINIEVSNDGGQNWTVLDVITGITGSFEGERVYDITPYISATTTVRIRVSNKYGGSNEIFKVDNLSINWSCEPPTGGGSGGGDNGSAPCTDCNHYTGQLGGTNDYDWQPNGTSYWAEAGSHQAWMEGTGEDFDLYLYYYNGSQWVVVASSYQNGSEEEISYNGPAGDYAWLVESYAGAGSYELWTSVP